MPRFLGSIVVPVLDAAPPTPVVGQMYTNAADGQLYVFDGADWARQGLPVYIQNNAPINPTDKFIWFQTGLGPEGNDWTMWFEDGT